MADPYLAIAEIAADQYMNDRMNAAATQQVYLGTVRLDGGALGWVSANSYVWASSPSWGEKWRYAQTLHESEVDYEPGKDEAVITDADILATVQALGDTSGSSQSQAENEPPEGEREDSTADQVAEENSEAG